MTVVAVSLTRHLIEAHLASGPVRGRTPGAGSEVALRPSHAVMDATTGPLVLQAFERAGAAAVGLDLALACAEAPLDASAFEAGEELRFVRTAAARYGLHFSPPGTGRAHHVYLARFATPGRLALACAGGLAAAGGMAVLVLPVSELELADALAGEPHATRVPEVWAVRLAGALAPGVGAHDLVLALARALPGGGGRPRTLEFFGDGVAGLDQEARFAVARGAAAAGLPPVLFPSDERTREWLRAQGREPDWRPLVGDPAADAARGIDVRLDTLEPAVARAGEGVDPLPVRDASGLPVRRVAVGADAGLGPLLALATALAGGRVAEGIELWVVPGSRQLRAALADGGALAALAAAGARFADVEARVPPGPAAGVALTCGASSAVGRAATVLRVGPEVAAVSALAGRLADPRERAAPAAAFPMPQRLPPVTGVVRPAGPGATVEVARGATLRPLPALTPLRSTLRGVVLARFPDRVRTDQVLPPGPRVWRHRGDAAALAEHLYAGLDPGFAARARALQGGFVVAGAEYGVGPRRPHVVLAMVALAVRVVIAESFAATHRDDLILHGVLPLRPAADLEPGELRVGDDLEIPGLPEMLEHQKPLIVRNLTRGCQLSFRHDLSAREIERVRAGGLLAARTRAGAAA